MFTGNSVEVGSTERVPRESIEVLDELHRRKTYRVHSAKFKQKFTIVKVFQGQQSRENLRNAITWNRRLLHPFIINMIAVSYSYDTPFIVFDTNCHTGSVEFQLASALTACLSRSIRLGFQIIGGLSGALDYLATSGLPLGSLVADNFEVYITNEGQVKVGVDCSEVKGASDNQNDEDVLWDLLDILCTKTFGNANHLLYNGYVEEDPFTYEPLEPGRKDIKTQGSVSGVFPDPPHDSQSATSISTLRRVLVWKRSERQSQTVASVARQYQDRLRLNSSLPYTDSLRQVRRGSCQSIGHRCQGYESLEEIILTSNVRDALVLHKHFARGLKLCFICGEEVLDCIGGLLGLL
ncbi:hypothetical protein K435DRAFT_75688 [Dendrothele bispora CBS 962.96]|uniref:Protein kinase domain-containing protein n=1 Tax=Dendrothele bispora (strain CBS 962.96) TaxID=1314807 RepID=A0A4V4HI99_DENBC|nr:hypothetical protein K435DRAFT_75688 [Dendrothele bispora CBS 962.96]